MLFCFLESLKICMGRLEVLQPESRYLFTRLFLLRRLLFSVTDFINLRGEVSRVVEH